jgi:hypothetical protein
VCGVEADSFVDNMQYWLALDIHDVDDNQIVEVNIVTEGKSEST